MIMMIIIASRKTSGSCAIQPYVYLRRKTVH
jgi:hypothetical protein